MPPLRYNKIFLTLLLIPFIDRCFNCDRCDRSPIAVQSQSEFDCDRSQFLLRSQFVKQLPLFLLMNSQSIAVSNCDQSQFYLRSIAVSTAIDRSCDRGSMNKRYGSGRLTLCPRIRWSSVTALATGGSPQSRFERRHGGSGHNVTS